MIEGGKITYKQIILLVFISRTIVAITIFPVFVAPPGNQDVWINMLIAFPIRLILAFPFYFLAKKFPTQTFYEYNQAITGKIGLGLGLLYICFFIHINSLSLSNFAGFFTAAIMPETPSLLFTMTLTLTAAYAVYQGIEGIGRLSEFFVPLIMIALLGIALLLAKDLDFRELTPVLEEGILPNLLGGLYVSSLTVEIIGIAIILPFLNQPEKTKSVFILAFLLLTLYLIILSLIVIALFGADLARQLTFPFFNAVRLVSVGNFLERIESFHVAIWILGMYLRVSFYYYLIVLGLGQIFHLKSYKPLILPVGTIIVSLTTVVGQNIVEIREFTSFKYYPWYTLVFIFVIPSILLLTASIRKKGVRMR